MTDLGSTLNSKRRRDDIALGWRRCPQPCGTERQHRRRQPPRDCRGWQRLHCHLSFTPPPRTGRVTAACPGKARPRMPTLPQGRPRTASSPRPWGTQAPSARPRSRRLNRQQRSRSNEIHAFRSVILMIATTLPSLSPQQNALTEVSESNILTGDCGGNEDEW